jgi:uncharacterized membrane protein YqjE
MLSAKPAPASGGLFHSAKALLPTALALVRTRLELFGVELAEEKGRLLGIALLGVVAAVCLAMALLLLNIVVMVAFWDTHRWAALACLMAVYALVALVCIVMLRARLREQPMVFAATLEELKQDLEAIKGPSADSVAQQAAKPVDQATSAS